MFLVDVFQVILSIPLFITHTHSQNSTYFCSKVTSENWQKFSFRNYFIFLVQLFWAAKYLKAMSAKRGNLLNLFLHSVLPRNFLKSLALALWEVQSRNLRGKNKFSMTKWIRKNMKQKVTSGTIHTRIRIRTNVRACHCGVENCPNCLSCPLHSHSRSRSHPHLQSSPYPKKSFGLETFLKRISLVMSTVVRNCFSHCNQLWWVESKKLPFYILTADCHKSDSKCNNLNTNRNNAPFRFDLVRMFGCSTSNSKKTF